MSCAQERQTANRVRETARALIAVLYRDREFLQREKEREFNTVSVGPKTANELFLRENLSVCADFSAH